MGKYTIAEYDNVKEDITNEEVISLLERIKSGWIPDYNYTGKEDDFEKYKLHIALEKAIDIIGKQVN